MKNLKYIILFLLLTTNAFAIPTTTISTPNSFSPNTVIESSKVNADFNEVTSKYNTHSHTDITQVGVITSGTWSATPIQTTYVAQGAGAITAEVRMWAGSGTSLPSGWLLCDGTAVSRTTYADLFAVISTNYGTGDGSTTFNLPNLTSKFARGNATAGSTGAGSDTHDHGAVTGSHVLSTAEMPSHSHVEKYSGNDGTTAGSFMSNSNAATASTNSNVSTDTAGGGGGHTHTISSADNIPVYENMVFMIKT